MHEPHTPRRRARTWALLSASFVVATAVCACTAPGSDGTVGSRPSSSSSTTAPLLSDADLWLSFEDQGVDYDGAPAYPDALDGPFVGRVVTANGGMVGEAPGADGSEVSLAFPPRCGAPTGCPRGMVEVLPNPALDPGEADFEYGATVWLAPDQTTSGSNLVQKGRFGTEGGQWKLQVDSVEGEPSCVVRSGTTVLVVRSGVSVADSTWHHVVCRRDESGLSIRVDDTVDRASGHTGSVANPWPVRIGSPGVGEDDDQFHGRIDDVFLRIGRRS